MKISHFPAGIDDYGPGFLQDADDPCEPEAAVHGPARIEEDVQGTPKRLDRFPGRRGVGTANDEDAESSLGQVTNESPQLGNVIQTLHSRELAYEIEDGVVGLRQFPKTHGGAVGRQQ